MPSAPQPRVVAEHDESYVHEPLHAVGRKQCLFYVEQHTTGWKREVWASWQQQNGDLHHQVIHGNGRVTAHEMEPLPYLTQLHADPAGCAAE